MRWTAQGGGPAAGGPPAAARARQSAAPSCAPEPRAHARLLPHGVQRHVVGPGAGQGRGAGRGQHPHQHTRVQHACGRWRGSSRRRGSMGSGGGAGARRAAAEGTCASAGAELAPWVRTLPGARHTERRPAPRRACRPRTRPMHGEPQLREEEVLLEQVAKVRPPHSGGLGGARPRPKPPAGRAGGRGHRRWVGGASAGGGPPCRLGSTCAPSPHSEGAGRGAHRLDRCPSVAMSSPNTSRPRTGWAAVARASGAPWAAAAAAAARTAASTAPGAAGTATLASR